jgi:beta-catenin-like protein 1
MLTPQEYRQRDPVDGEEEEFMESSFSSLCALVTPAKGKAVFLEDEGVELMIFIMKEKRLARSGAVKVLDYAMRTDAGTANCERFVEMLGLKTFFSLFMGKVSCRNRDS